MNTLVDKDLVRERGRPSKRYMLTDEGWEVATRILEATDSNGQPRPNPPPRPDPPERLEAEQQVAEATGSRAAARSPSIEIQEQPPQIVKHESSYADVIANGDSVPDDSALPNFRPIRLKPGTFTIQLVLDNREKISRSNADYMRDELAKKGVKPIVRTLEIGDALWVAKCADANFLSRVGAEGDEVMLDWLVERKRLDDLIGSIKDGRFREQKFRQKRAGVKNPIYVVEEISLDKTFFNQYQEAVQTAIATTQVVDGCFLKKTQNADDTIRYLARMTMMLKKQYESRDLLVIPTEKLTTQNYLPLLEHLRKKDPMAGHHVTYPAFASMASKSETMTLRDVFLKMLMCTRQVTGEKAIEIQKRWKTPHEFVKAFEACGSGEEGKKRKRELVSSQMGNLVGRKKIAKALSQKIAEVWADV